eukprot:CAMPEP_0113306152 /NCGR_PEP_ID=MMETSP0010_2-20120614/5515_1 /TAXON_ID=216773 ORGANISM="Corethron hystrix, Strain 308" /NCGR_SAMPLE_ID=MMETSP0010_2 /ASSEMBLY_ACC=CAM_ASM_000155 /LENGTH=641 /DNA_ID=CAMNT_0000160757 /DNA_START=46 /DNA_END=1971 /DNA_ORIENTATION=- /assembly_acc=CAM_ASM_000155
MRFASTALALASGISITNAFGLKYAATRQSFLSSTRPPRSQLSMVLEKPKEKTKVKKLAKIEELKTKCDYLKAPLLEEMKNEEIFVSKDAMQILKYHGSYQQSDREVRGKGKDYQFMLRLKQPAGEISPELFRLLDDLSRDMGQGDLRATTRMCFQLHGVRKGNLKTVVRSIMDIGGSTVGACGDISRNVMTSPAPFVSPEYQHAREWSKVFAQLFRPMTDAFSQIWCDGEKVATVETWAKEVEHLNVDEAMYYDNGRGVVLDDPVEPLYGTRYLPKKFKIGITVPGDNSLDIYINDIGLVVICDDNGELQGFNVMVGGGLGRTHNKEETFARACDHLGYVAKEDVMEAMKAILATQRDHGNRDVRTNARFKYLVHTLGIDKLRRLVESYYGKPIEPWKPIKDWKYNDWMGWWEQGDGKLFYGLHIDNGRVKDEGDFRLKTALRVLVDKYDMRMNMSPTQSIILCDIDPKDKADVEQILKDHGILSLEEVDPLARLSMSCPALPLCGLAMTEAERIMPSYIERMRALLVKMNINEEEILMRMTGCPNGCARPYMAELAFVGDGPKSYQVWLGGSPVLAGRTAFPYKSKVKDDVMEDCLEPVLAMFIEKRQQFEAFGDFCYRMGVDAIEEYANNYVLGSVKA